MKKSNHILPTKMLSNILEGHLRPEHPEGPQEIEKGIYLGSVIPATDHQFLHSLGITHILSAAVECTPKYKEKFDYCHLMISDHPTVEILGLFTSAIEFINAALASGGKVYIHCIAGVSRSASVTIAYLMATQKLSYRSAFNKVQKLRQAIRPNVGFARQLELFEEQGYQCLKPLSIKQLNDTIKYYRISAEPATPTELSNMQFSCVRCKTVLFDGKIVSFHNTEKSDKKKYCSYYYLSEIPWNKEEATSFENDGDVNCPNCKCCIGKFSWSGTNCSCGNFIVPSFAICKADVEVIKPN